MQSVPVRNTQFVQGSGSHASEREASRPGEDAFPFSQAQFNAPLVQELNPPPTQVLAASGLPTSALRAVPPMPESPESPRRVHQDKTVQREPRRIENFIRQNTPEEYQHDEVQPRRQDQHSEWHKDDAIRSSPTFVGSAVHRTSTPIRREKEINGSHSQEISPRRISTTHPEIHQACPATAPRASAAAPITQHTPQMGQQVAVFPDAVPQGTSAAEQRLTEENEYLRKNVLHLRNVKKVMENHIRGLEVRNNWLEQQNEQHKVLFQQQARREFELQSLSGGGCEMEIQNLHDQLEAVMQIKKALNAENLELQRRLEAKETEESETAKKATCVICMDNLANTVCLPCKHLAMCMDCAYLDKSSLCPICRKTVVEKMQIYCP
jgi:hypothetical protein